MANLGPYCAQGVHFHELLYRVKKISSKDQGTLADRVIKIMEEVGEIAAAHGILTGYKVPKKEWTETEVRENIKEECVDTMIMLFDIMTRDFDMGAYDIEQLFHEKCNAWQRVVEKKNQK
jgi:hypothetical protein